MYIMDPNPHYSVHESDTDAEFPTCTDVSQSEEESHYQDEIGRAHV